MSTLLLISVGPVQEFIASARKLRDLWFGSYLLSELSKTVARTLAAHGVELIFPAPASPDDLNKNSSLVVANKILAIVSDATAAEKAQLAAKYAWRAHLNCLGIETFAEIDKRFGRKVGVNATRFNAQMADYGEFFAVWTPVESEEKYHLARARVEQLLASRKNLRPFVAPVWPGAEIPKNSLDGFRESVTCEGAEIRGLLKKGERLDAMGCVKRFHVLTDEHERKHFLDLADVALTPWLQGLTKIPDARSSIDAFQAGLMDSGENRNEKKRQIAPSIPLQIEAECFFANQGELQKMEGVNADEVWAARKSMVMKCGEPPLYAVIMVGDGDHMGKMIDAIRSKDAHKNFSHKLSEFSGVAGKLVDQAGGSLIYAGGDDVMAYLPLYTAVGCADAIRKEFHAAMRAIHDAQKLDCDVPTFSAGLAIVHHSCPLDQALNLARKAERVAKVRGGRNALAIIQSKRSGSELEIHGKWDAVGSLEGIADRLDSIVGLYNQDDKVLPSRLGYELRQVMIETGGSGGMEFTVTDDALKPKNATAALVKRIFDHKNDGNIEKNRQLLKLLAGRTSVQQLSDELVITRQIAESVRLAQGGKNA